MYKITDRYFDVTRVGHQFDIKSINIQGHQYVIKIIYLSTAVSRKYFAFYAVTFMNSLSSVIVESISLIVFKKKLNDHCQPKNILI